MDQVVPGQSPVLLETKLTPPLIADASTLLVRQGLIDRITESGRERLLVVCAPAGYGKTTLVTQAVAGGNRRVCWLSLDERDNEPGRFVAYLIGALQGPNPANGNGPARDRSLANGGALWAMLETTLNEVGRSPAPITLVIDDYHRIENPIIHRLTSFLVEFMPAQLRLILTSRSVPPLPLARMRARGELLELRVDELSFTLEETAQYLAIESESRPLPPSLIKRIHARTEGWIVALRLLNMLLRDEPAERRTAIVEEFVGSRRQVAEYLMDEVLRKQAPDRRGFLLSTSILARLTGTLCNAVTGRADGQAMLQSLEQDGVLLFALDDRRQWYRYHHLLSELLVQQLGDDVGSDGVKLLHRRASAWLAEHDLVSDAIDHSLAAQDWDHAIEHLYRLGFEAIAYRRTLTLRGWLEALPDQVREADPTLGFWLGRTLSSACQPQSGHVLLEQAELAWIEAGELRRLGEVRLARAWSAMHDGRAEEALSLALSAIELNTERPVASRAVSSYTAGAALVRLGRTREALAMMAQASTEHRLPAIASVEMGRVLALLGRFDEAAAQIRTGLLNENPTDSHRRGLIWLADLHLAWNDFERAGEELRQAEELEAFLDAKSFFPLLEITRARLLWATGRSKLALAKIEAGIERARLAGAEPAAREAEAVRIGFLLAQGKLAEAQAWAVAAGLHSDGPVDYLCFEEHLVYARLLMAERLPDAALALLGRLRQSAEEDGRIVDTGRIRVVEALARQELNQQDAAHRDLAEAVSLLEPSGHVRCFVDEGPELIGLLRSIAGSGIHFDYVSKILNAAGRRPPAPAPTHDGLPDPLSRRELEVLRLVAVGLSNGEIAEQLLISVPTVKRHISTILDKLSVRSRTQAVSVARDHKLL